MDTVIVNVSVIAFTVNEATVQVLVDTISADNQSAIVIPNDVMRLTETAADTSKRIVAERGLPITGYQEQLHTFTEPNTVQNQRAITVAYMNLIQQPTTTSYKQQTTTFVPLPALKTVSTVQSTMITMALQRLRNNIDIYMMHIMPAEFTLTELQQCYQIILGSALDKRNFRKRIIATNMLEETGVNRSNVKRRPAGLYRYKKV